MIFPEQQNILRLESGRLHNAVDELAEEEPLEIRVRNRPVSITMRTSGHDEELAAGFLLTEGMIKDAKDVVHIAPLLRNANGNIVNVIPGPLVQVDLERLTRHVFASSSCGLCGKATIEAIGAQFPPVPEGPVVSAETLLALPGTMRRAQKAFARTGGLHAAALFDADGELLVLREDVGRHNAVDKVLGNALLNNLLPLESHILLVSGRTSFEIMQKALAARVPIVAAISAPTTLAADFAQTSRQTLVGFLREGRMNLYSHPQRIALHRR